MEALLTPLGREALCREITGAGSTVSMVEEMAEAEPRGEMHYWTDGANIFANDQAISDQQALCALKGNFILILQLMS